MTNHELARVCHEANRAYCQTLGDNSQPTWEDAPQWQVDSAVRGVEFHLENPEAGPSGSHENWLREKEIDGWVYGVTKDPDAKTHPCMVPYGDLSAEQRFKDHLFTAICATHRRFFLGA